MGIALFLVSHDLYGVIFLLSTNRSHGSFFKYSAYHDKCESPDCVNNQGFLYLRSNIGN